VEGLGVSCMAENKKSVLLYCDIIHTVKELDDADAGLLFKHYLSYINDENPEPPSKLIKIVFEPIKQNLKRDLKKWDETVQKRSIAGKAGAEAKWQKVATDGKRTNDMAKMAVIDTVNVIVKDNVNVNDTDIFIIVENQKVFEVLPILEYYEIQLNGTQKENGNIAWRPMVESWFNQHIGEEFKDAMHVKNSFKKHYLNNLKSVNGHPQRKKAFELNDYLTKK
jgi:hypothetical protein